MDPIVSVARLAALLDSPGPAGPPALLDVRWRLGGPPGIEDYRAAHLPGAYFLDLERDLAAPPGPGGRHPLPDSQTFAAAVGRAGVSSGRHVVVYDEGDGIAAGRAWWLLRYFGHEPVQLLDGGFRAWVAARHPVTREIPPPRPVEFVPRPGGMPTLDAEQAARLARDGLLLDARAAARFRGEIEPVDPVAGHIPGAVSAPAAQNVDQSGRLRPVAALRAHFTGLGAGPDVPIGVYCGSGVSAALDVLALELAGFRAALYPGSWSHWVGDPTRPVATGASGPVGHIPAGGGATGDPADLGQTEQPQ